MKQDGFELAQKIGEIIVDKKGKNVLTLEVGHFSSVANYLIICEGNVDRHVIAIAGSIVKTVRDEDKTRPHHVEGMSTGDWILIDYGVVLVHIFMPDLRERYQLEELWSRGKIVSSTSSK